MKSKVKKCCKWTLFTVFMFAVVGSVLASVLGHLGGHRRYHQGGGQGSWAMQGANLHHHFQHGQFHLIGLIFAILLWGIVISLIIKFIRRRKAKCRASRASIGTPVINSWSQPTPSPNADFLDQWERNLKNIKEVGKNGDL
jgi:hypothetical protein